jgi:hypothetical protein
MHAVKHRPAPVKHQRSQKLDPDITAPEGDFEQIAIVIEAGDLPLHTTHIYANRV